jgi:hypothetical protein
MATLINLTQCPHCDADSTLLRKLETDNIIGGRESRNPVVVCTNCGALMVRIGGVAGKLGWATHVPTGDVFFD